MYRALYRKWRPQTFDEVYGQEHITKTLKNEIANNRISHAYLFTGSRGTGKTTCARILTKAINCLNPVDGNPCNECEICKGIDSGTVLDVVEIDAASNNSVDNIRDLREEVNFTPATAKYRVYIIDEVHMLSQGAFNALLKTLEEPPSHVVFILATTEIHKLPATILSRCQRFDFNRISPDKIISRLQAVAQGENVKINDEAASLIANLADGGMRDALSMMDRCLSVTDDITQETVSSVAGIAGTAHMFRFSDCVAKRDCAAALELVDELHAGFCDVDRICTRLEEHFRNLMVAASVNNCESLIICSKAELEKYKESSKQLKLSKILECIGIISQTSVLIKNAPNKKIMLEAAVIKMCSPVLNIGETDNSELENRLSALENKISNLTDEAFSRLSEEKPKAEPFFSNSLPEQSKKIDSGEMQRTEAEDKPDKKEIKFSPSVISKSEKDEDETAAEPVVPVLSDFSDGPFDDWPEVLERLRKTDMPLYGLLAETTTLVKEGKLVIKSSNPTLYDFISTNNDVTNSRTHYVNLAQAIFDVTGKKIRIAVSNTVKQETNKNQPLAELQKKINDFNSQGE